MSVFTAQLNLNSSWDDAILTPKPKLLIYLKATWEADFRYANLFWPNNVLCAKLPGRREHLVPTLKTDDEF